MKVIHIHEQNEIKKPASDRKLISVFNVTEAEAITWAWENNMREVYYSYDNCAYGWVKDDQQA